MAKLIGLIGYPLRHTLSPFMFNELFKKKALDFEYQAFEIKPDELEKAVNILQTKGFIGFNVTIPHKEPILKFIKKLTPRAESCRSVNTVIIPPHGDLIGDNTDGLGFLNSLEEEKIIFDMSKNSSIIGAGGAARSIAEALAQKGVKSITFINRTIESAERLTEEFQSKFPNTQFRFIHLGSKGMVEEAFVNTSILINATPIGSYKTRFKGIPLSKLPASCVVSDLVYNPYTTQLLSSAKKLELTIHHGTGTLVHQASLAFKAWTGLDIQANEMHEILKTKIVSKG